MHKLEMYLLLWAVYLASIVFMLFDLYHNFYENIQKKYVFYLLTNATLILRVIGVFWFIIIIHACVPFFILFVIVYSNLETPHLKGVPLMFVWLPLVIQIVIAFLLFYLRMSGNSEDKGFYSGIHAHLGILVVVVYFWNLCHIVKEVAWCGLSSMAYMLMFLIITLTPHFQGLSKSVLMMQLHEDEPIETLTNISVQCGPVAPGHRREL